MPELDADFIISNNNQLNAEYEVSEGQHFDCSFEIYAAGTSWGGITGTLSNQTDLQDALDLKADKSEVEEDITTLDNKIDNVQSDLSGDINTLNTNLTNEISNRTTADSGLQTQINSVKQTADSAIQPNDNITLLNNNAGFITNTVNNLTNYYLKSETYTKTEVQALIASIPQFTVQIVQTLPQTGERMVLYLVPKDGEAPDVYNEYIWVEDEDEFELLGSTAVDLDGYATEVWVQNQGYATETYVNTGLATKQDTLVSGTNIKTINNETILGSGNIDIQSSTVAFGTSSTAGNVAQKEVSIPEITELNVGQILYIKPSASATVANLTIKLNDFTAYPIRYNNGAITTSTDDLVWNQNIVSQFIFDGTYWQFAGRGYDNNTTYTQNILFDRGNFVSGSGTYAITRYSICLQKPDMTWEKVTNTEENYSLNTNKTVNTHGFLLNGEMLYYSNTAVLANGAYSSANTMYRQYASFDIRYSANSTGTGYTTGDYIYLVGTIGVDGLFYLDTTTWWTNALPTSNDGKIYVKIGKYISGVSVSLEIEHPAYYHNGTRVCVYQSASNKQDTLVSGTNIKTINNQSLLGSGDITIQGGGGTWGSITGTLSDQTDLQNALNAKLNVSDVTEYTAQEVETLWGSIQ